MAEHPPDRMRIDRLLVERGFFESRAKAQDAIAAGHVSADGRTVAKPSEEVRFNAEITAAPAHPWVSRGALKLVAALDHFAIDPAGRICLDIGASTGGFTEVLLARGAARVHAVDVGRDQLHASLRGRPEVIAMEATDIRHLAPDAFAAPPSLVVIDVSFIPLRLVLPAARRLAAAEADLVALIKPQFEAGSRHLKKGIVRDPAVHSAVCAEVSARAAEAGWLPSGIIPSPIAGGDGNREFLLAARAMPAATS